MSTRLKYRQSVLERRRRVFSEEFRVQKVRELDCGQVTAAEICREYDVSRTTVLRWRARYSSNFMKGTKTIVEPLSDTRKIQELKARVAELERAVGQKQILIDFQSKMIELAEEVYKVDIKKKFDGSRSSAVGRNGKK